MKKRNLLMFLASSVLVLGVAPVAGHTIYNQVNPSVVRAVSTSTLDFAAQGYTNQQTIETVNGEGFTVTFNKGSNNNAPKYYTSGTAIRAYGGNTITVESSDTITSIVLTFGSSDGSNAITADVGNFVSPKWTGSANKVVFTIGGTSGNRRIAGVSVSFGGEVIPDPEPIEEPNVATKTVTELLALAADDAKAYQVTGTVKSISNSKYGNFILTDGTNNIDVYGASISENGLVWDTINGKYVTKTNIADFESSGITAGYTVTLKAIRNDHVSNGTTTKQLEGYVISFSAPEVPPTEYEEPSKVNATIEQLLSLTEQKKQIYKVTGIVESWANGKTDGTQYGNFNLTDGNGHTIYVYGSTADASALTWNKTSGEYSFDNPKTFLTDSLTKDIDINYTVEMEVIYLEYGGTKEIQGVIKSVTAPEAPADPEGYADDLNKINPYFSLAYKYTHHEQKQNEDESQYFLVTDEDQLTSGDHIIIVQELSDGSLYYASNEISNKGLVANSINDKSLSTINSLDSDALILSGTNGAWSLNLGDGELNYSKADLSKAAEGSGATLSLEVGTDTTYFYDASRHIMLRNTPTFKFYTADFGDVDYASKAYVYAKHSNGEAENEPFVEYTGVDFRLRMATTDMDEFALNYDVEDYGVYAEQGANKVYYSFAEAGVHYGDAKDGAHIQYFDVQLGNLFEHPERFGSTFTICAYSQLHGEYKYSTSTKSKSVADLVKDYKEVEHEDGVTNLYNILKDMGKIA